MFLEWNRENNEKNLMDFQLYLKIPFKYQSSVEDK